ncbi:MAG: hypothetical protein LBQ59_01705 [Candidatus Peribacteria bacterium]|nr:hypothetical protein [Candidatus Peribacteria bacterium]
MIPASATENLERSDAVFRGVVVGIKEQSKEFSNFKTTENVVEFKV